MQNTDNKDSSDLLSRVVITAAVTQARQDRQYIKM